MKKLSLMLLLSMAVAPALNGQTQSPSLWQQTKQALGLSAPRGVLLEGKAATPGLAGQAQSFNRVGFWQTVVEQLKAKYPADSLYVKHAEKNLQRAQYDQLHPRAHHRGGHHRGHRGWFGRHKAAKATHSTNHVKKHEGRFNKHAGKNAVEAAYRRGKRAGERHERDYLKAHGRYKKEGKKSGASSTRTKSKTAVA